MDKIKKELKDALDRGDSICLSVAPKFSNGHWVKADEVDEIVPFCFELYDDSICYEEEIYVTHDVFVSDVTDNGIWFWTWGKKGFISFEQLQQRGAFSLAYININV